MRRPLVSLLVFVWLGCHSSEEQVQRDLSNDRSSRNAAEQSPAKNRPSFEIRVPYVATLWVATTALAGVPGTFSTADAWSGWFADWAKRPPGWLKAFRSTWRPQQDRCARSEMPIAEFIACLQRYTPESQKEALATAMLRVHARLQPHWIKEQFYLDMFVERLHALLNSRSGQEAVQELRWFWDVDPAKLLDFTIILVLTPRYHPSARMGGQQTLGYLTLAVNLNRSVGSHTDTIFHEFCHLAARHSRQRAAFESALAAHGEDGLIAGAFWNETVASVYGRGLFAVRFNGPFALEKRRFYQHVAIDSLARGLYQTLTIDRSLRFGAKFGQRLSNIAATYYPTSKRTLRDLLNRFLLISTDGQMQHAVHLITHVDDLWFLTDWQQDALRSFKYAAPIVIVMNQSQLSSRRRMLEALDISPQHAAAFINRHHAGYYWQPKLASQPVLVVTAQSQAQTLAAFAKLLGTTAHNIRPRPGWHAL